MDWITELAMATEELKRGGRFRMLREIAPLPDGRCRWEGRTYINLSGNDYLGLSGNGALRAAFYEQFPDRSSPELAQSSTSSRLLTGNTPAYRRLEQLLSERYEHRAALVFNSGYHANVGILPALTTRRDCILSDKLNHASIIDGLRLCDAEHLRFPHRDLDHLDHWLSEKRALYHRVFLVTESIFSMDGDTADLRRMVALKEKYDCLLVVDEAHSVGVRGPQGLGLAAELGLQKKVDILIGTFGKALGSTGAFAIMEPDVRQYLINHMRPFIFTTGLPPIVLNWSAFALQQCATCDQERMKLQRMGSRLRACFERKNPGCTVAGDSPIVPFVIGPDAEAVKKAEYFQEKGLLVFPIRPPTVPPGTARLRFSLSAALDETLLSHVEELA